jgi:hypothetical protein
LLKIWNIMIRIYHFMIHMYQRKEENIMADEKNTAIAPGGAAPPAAPPVADPAARISELEGLLAGKTEELTKAGIRLAELEKAAAGAVSRYKAVIVQSNPDVLPELVTGESIEALDGSLAKARELIGKVKVGLEAQKAAARVPAGAPPRGPVDTSSLSSREKINLGVEKARGK